MAKGGGSERRPPRPLLVGELAKLLIIRVRGRTKEASLLLLVWREGVVRVATPLGHGQPLLDAADQLLEPRVHLRQLLRLRRGLLVHRTDESLHAVHHRRLYPPMGGVLQLRQAH